MGHHDIFISYKAEEFNEASWVKSVLEENGLSCWMAPASIPGGSSYAEEIDIAIKGCEIFVLILSERAQRSVWIKKELDRALAEGKVILPFMIEDCQLQSAFNYYLTDVQRYDAYTSKVAAMSEMIKRINAVLGKDVPAHAVGYTPSGSTPAAKPKGHAVRTVLFFGVFAIGLLLPPILVFAFKQEFTLWMRMLYFAWILFGAFWLWNKIETSPSFAATCYGTLSEADLCEPPERVFSKIAGAFGKKAFISNECPDDYRSFYKLRLLEFGSWDGVRTNYLRVEFKGRFEHYDPSVFYLHTLSRGSQAIKMLTHQNFVIQTPPKFVSPTTDYLTKGDFHVFLYYKGRKLAAAIVYNCSFAELESHFRGEYIDEKQSHK